MHRPDPPAQVRVHDDLGGSCRRRHRRTRRAGMAHDQEGPNPGSAPDDGVGLRAGRRTVLSRGVRSTCAMGFAFCLSLALLPLGCGGAQETGYTSRLARSEGPRRPEGPKAPEATVAALTTCVKQGAARLTDDHYAILFDVHATDEDDAPTVTVKDSLLGDREIEACMVRALEDMPLPAQFRGMRSRGVTAQDRGLMGTVGAGVGASLFPILITIAGVTVVVGVTYYAAEYVVEEVSEAINKRRLRYEKMCWPDYQECLKNNGQPEWNRDDFGDNKDCGACLRECKHENGEWPDYKCPRPGYVPGKKKN